MKIKIDKNKSGNDFIKKRIHFVFPKLNRIKKSIEKHFIVNYSNYINIDQSF